MTVAGAAGGGSPQVPIVVACLRHTDPRPRTDPVTGAITHSGHGQGASWAELAALELALRVAAAWGGRVLAVTAGPAAADATLREALAVGAEVLRVEWAAPETILELAGDEQALASALAGAIGPARPALVVCGDRSADRGTGALPAFLAHLLGAAQALGLVSLEPDGDRLLAQRRLPAGRREWLRVPLPAVCSVEAAGVRLRRAPLPGVLAAQRCTVPVLVPAGGVPGVGMPGVEVPGAGVPGGAPGVGMPGGPGMAAVRAGTPRAYRPRPRVVPPAPTGTPRERLLALTGALDQREPPTVTAPLTPARAADELLGYLRRAGHTGSGHTGSAHTGSAHTESGHTVSGHRGE